MPRAPKAFRISVAAATLCLLPLLAGCGGKSGNGNGSAVLMQNIASADGTINDAMTDLDGVQTEGTAMAANDATGGGSNTAAAEAKPAAPANASQGSEEVVADQ